MKIGLPPILQTIILASLLISVICIMILPVPSWLLDFGMAASFSLAILMLIVTLFIEKPLDFSAFPTILLGALVLRLSLNVASTKLIIGEGHTGTNAAGDVIEGFAMFIMSGNLAIGLVVFSVLLIVNFLVINKGATRMAEVGARFALDAMPGKQLAIDSDIASGAITHEMGKERREREQAETTFFGSLDGTSKFVKGDAVAGLIITLLNLIVGLCIGLFSHGMSLSDGFTTYSILTVGDGLVSQIPAVLISLAAAILLARGGTNGTTDFAISTELSRHPFALIVVGVLLFLFGLVPGLPAIPFMGLSTILLSVGIWSEWCSRSGKDTAVIPTDSCPEPQPTGAMADLLEIEEIQIEFSPELISMVLDPKRGLEGRILNIRRHIATEYGILVPEIHLTDASMLEQPQYVIRVMNIEVGRFNIDPERQLAINPTEETRQLDGENVSEPVYGAPGKWLDSKGSELAILAGDTVVEPAEIIATHLLDVIKGNLSRLFTYSALQSRLQQMTSLENTERSEFNQKFIDALIPEKVSMELLHSILRSLLSEKISIRNIRLIIEAIAEARQVSQNFEKVYHHVRSRLAPQIFDSIVKNEDSLNIVQLSQQWENTFAKYTTNSNEASVLGLPPDIISELVDKFKLSINRSRNKGETVAVACNDSRRSYIRDLLLAAGIDIPVVSFGELTHGRTFNIAEVVSP